MQKENIRTTREQYLEDKYPNIEFLHGKTKFFTKSSKEIQELIFETKNQNIDVMPFNMAVIQEEIQTKEGNSKIVKSIYSLLTERMILTGLKKEAKVEYITEDQILKGFLVTDFEHQTIYDKNGKQIYQTKFGKQILSTGEFIKCKTTWIKVEDIDGESKFVSFDGNELLLEENLLMDAVRTERSTILTCNYGIEKPSKWLNEQLKTIAMFKAGYEVTEIWEGSNRDLKRRLPEWMGVKTTMEMEVEDGEKIHYPLHQLQFIQWSRKDNILWDESKNVIYVLRMNSGQVEIYHYNGENEASLEIEQIGEIQSTIKVIPLF